jgi:hypothetical protein
VSRPALLVALALLPCACALANAGDSAPQIPLGTVEPSLVCEAHPNQSYALYLPNAYAIDRKWPVLFCFDPAARGATAVETFRSAAERFGYIVVGSNNSRNGPFPPSEAAMQAMWRDVFTRFAADPQRLYLAGYSGGARVATSLASSGRFQGVIGCGGAFIVGMKVSEPPKFAFLGSVGVDDYNYHELKGVDETLAKLGTPHRMTFFDGGHDWPPGHVAAQALGWFELLGMRSGARPKDEALVRTLFAERMAAADKMAPAEAYRELLSIARDFEGLVDVAALSARIRELANTKEVRSEKQSDRADENRELEARNELIGLAATESFSSFGDLIAGYRKESDAAEDTRQRRRARRIVRGTLINCRESGSLLVEAGRFDEAIPLYRAAAIIRPERSPFYDLARVLALGDEPREAVVTLEKAVKLGFADAKRLERDEAWKRLRSDPKFQALLAEVRKNTESVAPNSPRSSP